MLLKFRRVSKNIFLTNGPECKSKPRQLREIIWLGVRYRFSPIEYRAYQFFLKEKEYPKMLNYLSNYEISYKVRPKLYNPWMLPMLDNKLLFKKYFSASSLPLPCFYAFYHSEAGFTSDDYFFCSLKDFRSWLSRSAFKQFFIKPCGGKKGMGALAIVDVKLNKDNTFKLKDAQGEIWSDEELVSSMEKPESESNYSGYIIEERIENHPQLEKINPSSANTCRLLTLKRPDGTVSIPYATIRFGRKGSFVDSWSQGGVAFEVNVETGDLLEGCFSPQWESTQKIAWHPDSGIELTGFRVPYWQEVKELVQKAASITPEIKSVGWDVAVSKRGPLLVEGNGFWSPLIFQGVCGGFLNQENRKTLKQYQINVGR